MKTKISIAVLLLLLMITELGSEKIVMWLAIPTIIVGLVVLIAINKRAMHSKGLLRWTGPAATVAAVLAFVVPVVGAFTYWLTHVFAAIFVLILIIILLYKDKSKLS